VNLAGFYALAQAFQGVEVCVTPWQGGVNFHDANSGFTIKHGGYQYLSPPQALAFVRERDNLPNGDLDRTHRQQAVIDYVIWKLAHQGVLTDLGQLNGGTAAPGPGGHPGLLQRRPRQRRRRRGTTARLPGR